MKHTVTPLLGEGESHEPVIVPRRTRRRRWAGVMVSCVVLVLVGAGLYAALSKSSVAAGLSLVDHTDQPAPPFSLPALVSPTRTLSLTEFRGHDLVVNFWASWCFPCETEMPLLESVDRAEHGRVTFLGIDSNDTTGAAVAFLAKVHVTYAAASDPRGGVAGLYRVFGLPTTVFISPSGKMLGRHIGQLNAATLKAALHEAFGQGVATPKGTQADPGPAPRRSPRA